MDDEYAIRNVLTKLLKTLGFTVDEAENGIEAIQKYHQNFEKELSERYKFVILDLTIPGSMGGKETITELLKIDPNVNALVTSGYSNDPVIAHYQDYGFLGVISKPYSLQILSDVIGRFLQKIH